MVIPNLTKQSLFAKVAHGVLGGMKKMKIFGKLPDALNEIYVQNFGSADYKVLDDEMRKTFLPCTSCRYCTEYCPQELDIPALLKRYNEYAFTGAAISPAVLQKFPAEKQPSACLGCHSCEAVCPQNIKISEIMKDCAERLEKIPKWETMCREREEAAARLRAAQK